MVTPLRVLLLHDKPEVLQKLAKLLRDLPEVRCLVEETLRATEAVKHLRRSSFNLIIVAYPLAAADEFALVSKLNDEDDSPPLLLIDALSSRKNDQSAMQAGAMDYLGMDQITPDSLERSIQYAIQRHQTACKLQQELLVKNRFFAIISHDIKSPLAILRDTLGYLNQHMARMSPEQLRNFLVKAENRADSLVKMTEKLLTWSSLQSGRMQPRPEWVSPYEIVEQSVLQIQPQLDGKRITLHNQIAKSLMIYTDANMLETVMRNFLSNAIKFSFRDQPVFVRAGLRQHEVIITVQDHGLGMQPDTLDRLFHPDEIFSTRGTLSEEGNGLGLLLCKEFVETIGGRIEVESQFGKGAAFSIILPWKGSAEDSPIC